MKQTNYANLKPLKRSPRAYMALEAAKQRAGTLDDALKSGVKSRIEGAVDVAVRTGQKKILRGHNLSGANLTKYNLDDFDMRNTRLNNTRLGRASRADFSGSFSMNLKAHGDMRGSTWNGAAMIGASMKDAGLDGAQMKGAALVLCDLSGASATDLKISGFGYANSFANASMEKASIEGYHFKSDFYNVNMRDASVNAKLKGSDFSHADASRSNFVARDQEITLHAAKFDDAKVELQDVKDAESANMDRATFTGVKAEQLEEKVGADMLEREAPELTQHARPIDCYRKLKAIAEELPANDDAAAPQTPRRLLRRVLPALAA